MKTVSSSCLSSTENLSERQKNLARDTRSQICWFTRLRSFVHQSYDLIVYAPLNRKPMMSLKVKSLEDANAIPLTCGHTNESRHVLNRDPHEDRVGVIEVTGNVLGAVKCEIGKDVAECKDMIETGF